MYYNEDGPIFRGNVLPDQPEFLSFTSCFSEDKLIGLGMPFLLAIFGRCMPGKYCNDY